MNVLNGDRDLGLCGIQRDLYLLRHAVIAQPRKQEAEKNRAQCTPTRPRAKAWQKSSVSHDFAATRRQPRDSVLATPKFMGETVPVWTASMRAKVSGCESNA